MIIPQPADTPLQNAEKPLQNAPIPADGQGDAPALLALVGPFSCEFGIR